MMIPITLAVYSWVYQIGESLYVKRKPNNGIELKREKIVELLDKCPT